MSYFDGFHLRYVTDQKFKIIISIAINVVQLIYGDLFFLKVVCLFFFLFKAIN